MLQWLKSLADASAKTRSRSSLARNLRLKATCIIEATTFVKRFDANSYLYITKAIDYFNILNGNKNLANIFSGLKAKVLVISFKSDWLYPSYQSQEIVKACKLAGVDTTYCEINSTYGHDAFLLETERETQLIKHFLNTVSNGHNGVKQ